MASPMNRDDVVTPPDVHGPKPEYWEEASRHLVRRDRILRRLIPRHADEWLMPASSAFITLARIIIGQQLSAKGADESWQRFLDACDDKPTPTIVQRLAASDDGLSWLSRRKGEYIAGLADHFLTEWKDAPCWDGVDDEAVITQLCSLRGVGRWTAEMFLIFNLHRPDVLPLDDAGLLKAISLHYFSGEPVSRFEAREVAQAWAPWRTVAAWYLWRSLDPAAVRY